MNFARQARVVDLAQLPQAVAPMEIDIRQLAAKNTQIPVERFTFLQDANDYLIRERKCAILFVFAAWSGPARAGWCRLTRLLSGFELHSVELLVIDIDRLNAEDMLRIFGHALGGAGETFWIRDGQVQHEVATHRVEAEADILTNTARLLAESNASF